MSGQVLYLSRTMGLVRNFLTMNGLTLVSRLFGLIREILLLHFMGASVEMDAYTTAFKFPSFFRRFFAEGGFQSIFVPYYTDYMSFSKFKGAKYFSSRIFTLIFWMMLFISIIVFLFAKEFTILMAPGFASDPDKLALTTEFTRIIFPSIAFISLSTVYSGILVSQKKFFIFSLAPIFVNIILISSLFVCQDLTSAGRRYSYGTLVAGIFMFLYMFSCVKYHGFPSPRFSTIRRSPKLKIFLKKMLPVLVGAGVAQINVLAGTFFASFLETGCVTCLACADRFVQLPLSLFGVTMGTILLSEIAGKVTKNQENDIKEIKNKSFLFTMRLTLPSVIGFITMSYLMISLLYGHGKFDQYAIENTSNILKVTACGLPALVLSKIMSSILFAYKDTKTPVIAAVISIIVNVILSIVLIKPLGIIGVALSSSVAGYVNVYVMCRKTNGCFSITKTVLIDFLKIIVASSLLTIMLFILEPQIGVQRTKIQEFLLLTFMIVTGGAIYLSTLYLLKDKVVMRLVAKIKSKFNNC